MNASAADHRRDRGSPSPPRRLKTALLLRALQRQPRRISAMVRVHNEEEFLAAAVRSIIASVDEVVLIDNASTDATPAVIAALRRAYPARIAVHHYAHPIARVGRETWDALTASGGRSARLSGVYYTWCLRRCTQPYVLKWDGDMIATAAFHRGIAAWRRERAAVLVMSGVNVAPDRRHAVAARSSDRAALLARQSCPRMPIWVTTLTRDCPEPRLFPRRFACYDHAAGFTQTLRSPYLDRDVHPVVRSEIAEPAYLHMKFCKRDPYANYSPDLAQVIAENLITGPALEPQWVHALEQVEIDAGTIAAG
jgi:hypothetical protein